MPHRGHGGHGPDHRDPGERAGAARGESAGEARHRGARQRQLPVTRHTARAANDPSVFTITEKDPPSVLIVIVKLCVIFAKVRLKLYTRHAYLDNIVIVTLCRFEARGITPVSFLESTPLKYKHKAALLCSHIHIHTLHLGYFYPFELTCHVSRV